MAGCAFAVDTTVKNQSRSEAEIEVEILSPSFDEVAHGSDGGLLSLARDFEIGEN